MGHQISLQTGRSGYPCRSGHFFRPAQTQNVLEYGGISRIFAKGQRLSDSWQRLSQLWAKSFARGNAMPIFTLGDRESLLLLANRQRR